MLRFPEEQRRLGSLRSLAIPRLLIVSEGAPPPDLGDTLEDWIWDSAPPEDRVQRVVTLERRARARSRVPALDDSGLLLFRGRSTHLSPTEARLAGEFIDHFDRIVGRAAVARVVWPNHGYRPKTLDMHILKLRRRVADVDLVIDTIRSRGWLMHVRDGTNPE